MVNIKKNSAKEMVQISFIGPEQRLRVDCMGAPVAAGKGSDNDPA